MMMRQLLTNLLDEAFSEATSGAPHLFHEAFVETAFGSNRLTKMQALTCLAKIMACSMPRDKAREALSAAELALAPFFELPHSSANSLAFDAPAIGCAPFENAAPVFIALPHSGRNYNADFLQKSALRLPDLRRSEDAFVDLLVEDVIKQGAFLLKAQFPRAMLDVNREPFELDAAMFADALPDFVNSASLRVAGGLGTIPRLVGEGLQIYDSLLPVASMWQMLAQYYLPYHFAMMQGVAAIKRQFGMAIIVDCHSMPSSAVMVRGSSRIGKARRQDGRHSATRADFVLGDRFGTSSMPALMDLMEQSLKAKGYQVARNVPYAGGFITECYGVPRQQQYAVQLEICRDLYMDEETLTLHAGSVQLKEDLSALFSEVLAFAKLMMPQDFSKPYSTIAIAAE